MNGLRLAFALTTLAHTALCEVPSLAIPEILSGRHDYEGATLTGTVVDVLDDETDPEHVFLFVRQGGDSILVPVNNAKARYRELRELVGATATFTGRCDATVQWNMRRHMGRRFNVTSPEDIAVVTPAPDIFDAPDCLSLDASRPEEIASSRRHRTVGRVLAAWDGNNVLILTPSNRLMRIELADPEPPRFGESVEAVGFPETDLYHLNLVRARWRPTTLPDAPVETVRDTTLRELFEDLPSGKPIFQEKLYGKTLRLKGRVADMPRDGVMKIADGAFTLAVDISALGRELPSQLDAGCIVEATGSCIMDVPNWRPHAPFPKISGITLVARTQDDIRLLAHAPWWTPRRLLAVIIGLVVALLAFFTWNRILRRIVERRGRELFKEQVAHVSANLRTQERTRLAIELHDSISQNLTGIALELKAAHTAAGEDLPTALSHLAIAERSLASCHGELRNCLWDLRHGTLESLDMNEAIRQTLRPQIGDVNLAVRFSVPRRRLTDNTAYAILKIVRELAVNATRHGKATEIRVAGAIDIDQLQFSVADNGCGFDSNAAPGPAEGHFGLLGITERIEGLEGKMNIESAPGRGTKVTISLSMQRENEVPDGKD